MRTTRAILAAGCALLALCAQAPAQDAPSKPLRHLTYSFSADYEGTAQYHYNGGGGVNPVGGTGSAARSAGRKGTIDVNILSLAPDGALDISIAEWRQFQPRADATYTCAVYGNTTVVCPDTASPTDAEWALLSFLGRRFVDGAPWDDHNHWQLKENRPDFDLLADFKIANLTDVKSVEVTETRKVTTHNAGFGSITDNATITYSRLMEIPTSVSVDRVTTQGNGSMHATFEFTLTSDSFNVTH